MSNESKCAGNDLKLCPFCGKPGELVHYEYREAPDCGGERIPDLDHFYVQCTGCNMVKTPGYGTANYSTKKEAIESWNERQITNLTKEIEAIRVALKGYPDSNLASLAETLVSRNKALEKENEELKAENKKLSLKYRMYKADHGGEVEFADGDKIQVHND